MKLYYSLTTIDPIIVSQNNATTNNHECLDYIPGSAILGAMAAQLYPQVEDEQSWTIFHTGDVKFGPCYPIAGNQLALPTPASWHFAKGETVISDQRYNKGKVSNHASQIFQRDDLIQYKQCRDGYVNPTAHAAQVNKGLTTRTAIDSLSNAKQSKKGSTGIAKEGSLFSYSYIEAGQTFVGWVDSNDDKNLDQIRAKLAGQLKIGRSRNTEFGRVNIQLLGDTPASTPATDSQQLVIWCLSDCQCLNAFGLPTFVPELTDLIPGAQGEFDAERSFIRTTKVSRFNQKRAGLDSEQHLICKGSVLVYNKIIPSLSPVQLAQLQQTGIGINQQQGLGWVMVNPAWAQEATLSDNPLFTGITVSTTTKITSNSKPNSALTRWVAAKQGKESAAEDRQQQVKALLKSIGEAYRNARRYNNILNSYQAGPSSSQWRRISDELRNNNQNWKNVLFTGEHAICKASNDDFGWGISWDNGQQLTSFANHLAQLFLDKDDTVILSLLSQMTRYDLSNFKELKKAAKELGFDLYENQEATHQEAQ